MLVAKVDWDQKTKDKSFVVTCYGEREVEFLDESERLQKEYYTEKKF